jgi:hypothetical protein
MDYYIELVCSHADFDAVSGKLDSLRCQLSSSSNKPYLFWVLHVTAGPFGWGSLAHILWFNYALGHREGF